MWNRVDEILSSCDNYTTIYGQPIKDVEPNYFTKIRLANNKWHCDDLRNLHDASVTSRPVGGQILGARDQQLVAKYYQKIEDNYDRPRLKFLVEKLVPEPCQANFYSCNGFVFDLFLEDLIEKDYLVLAEYRQMLRGSPELYSQKVAILNMLQTIPAHKLHLIFYQRFLEPDRIDINTLDQMLKVLTK